MDDCVVLGYKPQYNLSNAKEYFDEHLAVGEYYSEGQIVAGEWLGEGARLLSLTGTVKAEQFLALCDNLNPNTGEKLTVRTKSKRKMVREDHSVTEKADRRVFYDFTISPPKSVSILALAGGDERIIAAHDEAVRVAMSELERFASTRVRANMKNEDRTTANLVTAVSRQHGAVQASDALFAIEKYGHLPVAEFNEIRRQDPARARNMGARASATLCSDSTGGGHRGDRNRDSVHKRWE